MKRRIGSFFYKSSLQSKETAKAKWNIPAILWKAVKKTCTVIGAFILFWAAMGAASFFVFGNSTKMAFPDQMVLTFNIADPIGETENERSFADPFAPAGMTVRDVVLTLDRASVDTRVKGILVSLDNAGMELAHIQELRTAVKRFRGTGKFAHIYTASFSDLGSGIGAYYFASAFEQIWMQPIGFVSITGLSMEMPFARAALEKLGATPEFLHREEYKSAMESFTNEKMSDANREAMTTMLQDMSNQIFNDVVKDRDIAPKSLEAYLNKGLLTGVDALKGKLITNLDYADNLLDVATNKDELELIDFNDYYAAQDFSGAKHGKQVALVNIVGEIVPGAEPEPGLATGDYIAAAIEEAGEDENIEAIIIRVDSPGGSPTASETIRRAIVKAKEKGKKIIVSMGAVAASGGYWVSVDADRIFAMPSTITGSIGVIMGKFELSALWKKVGVNWDGISWGDNARIWSMNAPMSEGHRTVLNEAIDDTYNAFLKRVSDGRKMDVQKVRSVAKGRPWTGTQALQNGLVDEIGGLDRAMDYTAQQLGARDRSALKIRVMPEPLTPLEQIVHMMGSQVSFENFLKNSMIGEFFNRTEISRRAGIAQTYEPDLRILP